MEQFFLWLNVIAFTVLASALSSSFHIYIKNKAHWIKYYLLTKLGFFIWLALYTYDYFSFIYISPEHSISQGRIAGLLVLLISGFIIYAYSLFLLALTGKKSRFIIKLLSIITPLCFLAAGIVFVIFDNAVFENYLHISFYLVLFFYSLYGLYYRKTITHDRSRNWGFTFIILTLVFTPLLFFEYCLFHFSFTGTGYFPESVLLLPFYCITWGLWMIINNSLLIDTVETGRFESIPGDFIIKHSITEREKEIISYLVSGNNNIDIASRLFISLRTVDTHVYNIYKKCNVKNRVALLKEIDSHRSS